MKTLKRYDLFVQLCFMVLALTLVPISVQWMTGVAIILGLWQVAGMIYHQLTGTYTGRLMPRYYFHRIAAGAALIVLLLVFTLSTFPILVLYPLLSIFFVSYSYICYLETYRYMIRPLELV